MLMLARTLFQRVSPPPAAAGGPTSAWNPADKSTNAALTVSNTVLNDSSNGSGGGARGSLSWSTGKHYCEIKLVAAGGAGGGDLAMLGTATTSLAGVTAGSYGLGASAGKYVTIDNGAGLAFLSSGALAPANNDVIGLAYDAGIGIFVSVNGTFYNSGGTSTGTSPTSATFSVTGAVLFPLAQVLSNASNATINTNPTPPAGYTAWG